MLILALVGPGCVEPKLAEPEPPPVVGAAVGRGGMDGSVCVVQGTGSVFCWAEPGAQFDPSPEALISIDGGGYGYCGVTADDELYCWGEAPDGGELPSGPVSDYSVMGTALCYLDSEGYATCHGDEYWNAPAPAEFPTDVAVSRISATPDGVCMLTASGEIECYDNGKGGWDAPPPTGTFVDLSVGWYDGCALAEDGRAACWPIGIEAPSDTFAMVSAGYAYACGVTTSRDLKCWPHWGSAVPENKDSLEYSAHLITSRQPESGEFSTVDSGSRYAVAVTTDGGVEVFGDWEYGTYADAWFAAHPE